MLSGFELSSLGAPVKSKSVTEFLLGRRANEWDSNKYEYKIHIFSPLCNNILRFLE